jgi:3-deoxy-D-manno-octulosonate 8-phosphate phosphatase (KDO 8-P phosphatase)
MIDYRELLKKINTLIFDYDGVLTDGNIWLVSDNNFVRTSNIKDGYILQLAAKKGFKVIIISGSDSETVKKRFLKLGIKDVFVGIENKFEFYKNYITKNNIDSKNVLYMGDDIPDYEIMLNVGLPACPADAVEEIKSISKYISYKNGGQGCVRDIVEQVLKINDKWMR